MFRDERFEGDVLGIFTEVGEKVRDDLLLDGGGGVDLLLLRLEFGLQAAKVDLEAPGGAAEDEQDQAEEGAERAEAGGEVVQVGGFHGMRLRCPERGAGGAFDEMDGENGFLRVVETAAASEVFEELHSADGHLFGGKADGGERGGKHGGDGIIPAGEEAEGVGDFPPDGLGAGEDADGGAVAEAKDGGGFGLAADEGIERRASRGGGEIAVEDIVRLHMEAEFFTGGADAAV